MTESRASHAVKTALQVVAVLGMMLIAAMILHKGTADVSALAQKHSGIEFWKALARYVLRNLGAG